MKLALGVS